MAGDWIKMRCNLWDDPRVAKLCDLTDSSEAAVIGAMYWLWASADQHSEDGVMPGLTPKAIDRKTGVKGFGDAMIAIGWLADHPEGVRIVRFDEHNGQSAKRRCSESRRKMSARNADTMRTCSAPREDKREEKSQQPISEGTVEIATLPPAKQSATTNRGSRLPADWRLPKDWGDWALQEKPGWSAADVRRCADKFRDHWHSATGRNSTKADWLATWRNWVRNEQGPPARASPRDLREEEGRRVMQVLTGKGNHEQRIERDITGEALRIAG